ncbi:uncharacterized PE-PGRS family protein PE_PGRS46 [Frankliniella occidentalis]|uniref:Uncharacterized PE-PGRS family protein PE_PGRS46 n=1 Tax=Frankliniella occidentalis TaxID=133901 RepID=A0A6J1T6R2_FRAOC|nr:uncharacterized PE-PGRS family protein PE_PGRS46 [Frankliniella occidentalis]
MRQLLALALLALAMHLTRGFSQEKGYTQSSLQPARATTQRESKGVRIADGIASHKHSLQITIKPGISIEVFAPAQPGRPAVYTHIYNPSKNESLEIGKQVQGTGKTEDNLREGNYSESKLYVNVNRTELQGGDKLSGATQEVGTGDVLKEVVKNAVNEQIGKKTGSVLKGGVNEWGGHISTVGSNAEKGDTNTRVGASRGSQREGSLEGSSFDSGSGIENIVQALHGVGHANKIEKSGKRETVSSDGTATGGADSGTKYLGSVKVGSELKESGTLGDKFQYGANRTGSFGGSGFQGEKIVAELGNSGVGLKGVPGGVGEGVQDPFKKESIFQGSVKQSVSLLDLDTPKLASGLKGSQQPLLGLNGGVKVGRVLKGSAIAGSGGGLGGGRVELEGAGRGGRVTLEGSAKGVGSLKFGNKEFGLQESLRTGGGGTRESGVLALEAGNTEVKSTGSGRLQVEGAEGAGRGLQGSKKLYLHVHVRPKFRAGGDLDKEERKDKKVGGKDEGDRDASST